MADFKVNRGNSTSLPSTKTDGWAYFCTDTGEFFIDYKDDNGTLQRKKISGNYYGECTTAAATVAKTVNISSFNAASLIPGAQVTIKFTEANSATAPTLNISGTGAYPIVRYGTTAIGTGTTTSGWYAESINTFTFDGTSWVRDYWNNTTYSNASLGCGYGTCATTETDTAKVVTLSSYSLTTGGIVAVKFTYNVPAGSTMNINGKGAKAIYYRGAAITNGIIKAGDIATFIYSTRYHLISIDRDENTTYSAATTSADGLMSAADKVKLNGIATGANAYTLPTASSTLGGVKTTSTVTSTSGLTACPIISGVPYYKDTTYTLSGLGGVPTTRTINSKALSSDITLSASDVSAVPTTRTVNNKALGANITLSASDVGAVPTTRTVNGKALSSNITLSASDVSAVPITTTVNGKALSGNITLTASDVGAAASSHTHAAGDITSGTLAVARGGTGVTANPSMLTNLGSTTAASVFAASPRPGVTGTLPIVNGGTGATTTTDARDSLGITVEWLNEVHNHSGQSLNPGSIELNPGTSTTHGGYIDFHYAGSTDDYTTRIIESAKNMLTIQEGNLTISKTSSPQLKIHNGTNNRDTYLLNSNATNASYWYNQADSNNYTILRLNPETTDLSSAIQLVHKSGGTQTTYNVLHSGMDGGISGIKTIDWKFWGSDGTYVTKTLTLDHAAKFVHISTFMGIEEGTEIEYTPAVYTGDNSNLLGSRIILPNNTYSPFGPPLLDRATVNSMILPSQAAYWYTVYGIKLSTDGLTLTFIGDGNEDYKYIITGFYVY